MNDIEYDKVGIIRSIGGLQRINRNLLKILKDVFDREVFFKNLDNIEGII